METDKIQTIEEVSDYLKIPKQTLYLWARNGSIPAIKVGKHWRFKKSSIDKWIEHKEEYARQKNKWKIKL
ncbi:MAG: DNA-binding protein [Candidatus Omnitrophica bacterium CG11_big_fil_rev_8_21_14_0_20_42_13]|uniref:DNA-binding protein n=1 Tax=Candidatus Ghiorseimicrobium undicola TaxID=1974746 RepID=A0A2H0LZS2_9BACT|nr:MAG: DNA-binding protein [Candidatus Omnitrophica bacterium CG11_big_fil_rev_8_21_14_0_20_42_13]